MGFKKSRRTVNIDKFFGLVNSGAVAGIVGRKRHKVTELRTARSVPVGFIFILPLFLQYLKLCRVFNHFLDKPFLHFFFKKDRTMRNYFSALFFGITALTVSSIYAEVINKDAIPEKIVTQFYKKHPDIVDFTARKKKHFGQDLYELYFKEGDEKRIELYRAAGPFYVNGVLIDASGMVPPAAFDNLKADFGDYKIKEAILVVNPNGPGEEYDFTVSSSEGEWNVSVDGEGKILSKEP
jgi:hypothetical protein